MITLILDGLGQLVPISQLPPVWTPPGGMPGSTGGGEVSWTPILWSGLLALAILVAGSVGLYVLACHKTAALRYRAIESDPGAKVSEVFGVVHWSWLPWGALLLVVSAATGALTWYFIR